VAFSARCILKSFQAFFDLENELGQLTSGLSVAIYLAGFFGFVYWLRLTFIIRRRENSLVISNEEYQTAVYLIAMLCGAVGVFISNIVCNSMFWPQSNEANLVSYAFIQLGFTVMVTGAFYCLSIFDNDKNLLL